MVTPWKILKDVSETLSTPTGVVLLGSTAFLSGLVIGLVLSPAKAGLIRIACDNGSHNSQTEYALPEPEEGLAKTR